MSGDERRNLFTYATKELSQDAFLMWLFNNYDDEKVGPVAYALLQKFCNLAKDEKIRALETKAQWKDIDISVWFETDKNKKYTLFIEDKVDSGEHNQLEKYNGHIKEEEKKGKEVYKVYYKPGYLYDDEIDRVEKAGWKWFSFDMICKMLKPVAGSSHPIVRQYIEHVLAREDVLSTTEKPEKSDTQLDFLAWLSFLGKTVIPRLKKEFDKSDLTLGAWRAGQYPYIVLVARYHGDEKVPYLEIRSRDCVPDEKDKGKFMARILCYGMDEKFIPQQEALIERIKGSELFECKNLHYYKKGKKIFPKQIGYTKQDTTKAATTEEFIAAVRQSVQAYLDLMKDWDSPLPNNSEQ